MTSKSESQTTPRRHETALLCRRCGHAVASHPSGKGLEVLREGSDDCGEPLEDVPGGRAALERIIRRQRHVW